MFGWPLLVHYCEFCHYNTTISYSSTVWIEHHRCSHCGQTSPGADIAGRSAAEMNQSQHDELARMFSQNMQLSQQHQRQQQVQQPPTIPHFQPASEKQNGQSVHFVSSHYTGTAHVRPDTTSEPSRSPPPPYHVAIMPEAMCELLRQQSIDPSALLPSQIHLFQNADNEQRLRLLELWRIAPPSYPLEEHLNGTWISTSLEREEALARSRYEQRQQQSQQQAEQITYQEEHMLDTHMPRALSGRRSPEPISPIREAGEAAWPPAARMRVSSISRSRPQTRYGEPEPYIVNGYEADQNAKAVDPIWAAAAGLWQAPDYTQATQQQQSSLMAEQYGMYEQIRNHADWERSNEQLARGTLAQGNEMVEDHEMEL